MSDSKSPTKTTSEPVKTPQSSDKKVKENSSPLNANLSQQVTLCESASQKNTNVFSDQRSKALGSMSVSQLK